MSLSNMTKYTAALIRYDIAKLAEKIDRITLTDGTQALYVRLNTELERKERELVTATRRELKRLAKVLTLKADIYGPNGRIYSHEAKWSVTPDGTLMHGNAIINPSSLRDGHGQQITV